jgi:hypothetical protein
MLVSLRVAPALVWEPFGLVSDDAVSMFEILMFAVLAGAFH